MDSTNANKPSKIDTGKKFEAKVLPIKKNTIVDSVKKRFTVDSSKIKDSIRLVDSTAKANALIDSLHKDSLAKVAAKNALPKIDTSTFATILAAPYLPFGKEVEFKLQKDHHADKKDELFYMLAAAFILAGFVKIVFPKYFNNMFGLFFQTTLRSKQTREQLLQNKLASLLMNLLFIATGGIYIALVVRLKGWVSVDFWWLIVYASAILAITYTVKFLFLQFSGWVFNTKEAAQTYIFVVFLSNKIIAIALLPFLIVLSFNVGQIAEITYTISLFLIIAMLIYRYLVSLSSIRKDLSINPLHFFLYLCTVEILPLLIIYKAAFNYIGTSI
jgi:hypothetical protein